VKHAPCILLVLLAAVGFAAAEEPEPNPGAGAGDSVPMEFESFQLVLLKRPAEPAEYPPEKLEEIQRGHLGYLERMGREGHMVAAGPFGDQADESLRGLALYRVGSVERARELAEGDPAVRAGRLEVEVMTFYTLKGSLAFPMADELAAARAAESGDGSGDPAAPPDEAGP
jgi:uncharacterized protein YciI